MIFFFNKYDPLILKELIFGIRKNDENSQRFHRIFGLFIIHNFTLDNKQTDDKNIVSDHTNLDKLWTKKRKIIGKQKNKKVILVETTNFNKLFLIWFYLLVFVKYKKLKN